MLKNILNTPGVEILTKTQLKVVKGSGVCGVKVGGMWIGVSDINGDGGTRDDAEGAVGHSGVWGLSNGQTVTGTATNWCCDSCSWNAVQ